MVFLVKMSKWNYLKGEVRKAFLLFFIFWGFGWNNIGVGFRWRDLRGKVRLGIWLERFQESSFNKVFHFKNGEFCWSVVVKLFCFWNFNRRFNWIGITLKGDGWKLLFWWFGLSTAKYSFKNPSDPTPTQIYLKNNLI